MFFEQGDNRNYKEYDQVPRNLSIIPVPRVQMIRTVEISLFSPLETDSANTPHGCTRTSTENQIPLPITVSM